MRSSRSDYATLSKTTAQSIVRIKNALSEKSKEDYSSLQLPKDSLACFTCQGVAKSPTQMSAFTWQKGETMDSGTAYFCFIVTTVTKLIRKSVSINRVPYQPTLSCSILMGIRLYKSLTDLCVGTSHGLCNSLVLIIA